MTVLRSPRPLAAVLLLSAAATLTGCGDGRLKVYPVTGQVLYNGEPLPGVDVAFHPVDPKNDTGYPPHATTDADGKFALTTYLKDDGAPAGDFQVAIAFAVQSSEDGSDQTKRITFQVPAKYHRKDTTDVKVTVTPGSNALDPIKLDGPPRPRRP